MGAAYNLIYAPELNLEVEEEFYVETGEAWEAIYSRLNDRNALSKPGAFYMLAKQMDVNEYVKPGKYLLKPGMSQLQLLRKLRAGQWENVVIKIKADMSRDSLVSYLAANLQAKGPKIQEILESKWVEENGFTRENVYCIFLPDHYFFNWATPADQVIERFYKEYQKFWKKERLVKAYNLELSAEEACILAAIVDGEAVHVSEMPTIAGLYLNRLNMGMALQADPTVMYANREEGRQRVLDEDKDEEHPYNTYHYVGLPPGPIMLPDKRAIEAVLDPVEHNYIYMCAKEDGSYYHYFTASYAEHRRNAARYRMSLNRQGIRR